MSKESVDKIIKSCIVSRKGGMPLLEIEDEYRELVGEDIPYASMGYKTLLEFINGISFVKVRQNYFGDSVLHVSDPKTAHIDSLVRKQKNPSSRVSSSKHNRKNRFAKGYQGGKFGLNNEGASYQRPENFARNTRMEYAQSKWYTDRAKDSWRQRRNESRAVSRYDNFNAGRTTLPNSGTDSSPQNDNSWSGRMTSQSSMEENSYNFRSKEESRYAEESRSWRVQLRVADYKQNSMKVALEPVVNQNQLIGDDFFLQLAVKNFRAEFRRPRDCYGIGCGLCISGQTIDECRQRLEKTQFLSSRVTILLGAVDIFRGHSLDRMVADMKKLLDVCRNRFNLSDEDITLCTIPPLANYSVRCKLSKLSVLYSFNNWIKLHGNYQLDDSYVHHYNVVDIFSRFTDATYRTLYDYFEADASLVSGCPHPHVLWNNRGRKTALSMLM